jgi:hypothetical protein
MLVNLNNLGPSLHELPFDSILFDKRDFFPLLQAPVHLIHLVIFEEQVLLSWSPELESPYLVRNNIVVVSLGELLQVDLPFHVQE